MIGNSINSGNTLAPYGGPRPPKGTGIHRYVFLVYSQPNVIENTSPISDSGRDHFDARKYAKQHNLGQPTAINFFLAQNQQNYLQYFPNRLIYTLF